MCSKRALILRTYFPSVCQGTVFAVINLTGTPFRPAPVYNFAFRFKGANNFPCPQIANHLCWGTGFWNFLSFYLHHVSGHSFQLHVEHRRKQLSHMCLTVCHLLYFTFQLETETSVLNRGLIIFLSHRRKCVTKFTKK